MRMFRDLGITPETPEDVEKRHQEYLSKSMDEEHDTVLKDRIVLPGEDAISRYRLDTLR